MAKARGTSLSLIVGIVLIGASVCVFAAIGLNASTAPSGAVAGVVGTPEPSPSPAAVVPSPPPAAVAFGPTATSPPLSSAPTPADRPYADRLSGTWLLWERVDPVARATGVYPSGALLVVRPTCKEGACDVTAKLKDPRSGKVLDTMTADLTETGYRIQLRAKHLDLCRGADGRTVKDGAYRRTTFTIEPWVQAGATTFTLGATGTVRLAPNTRGRSVGCQAGTYEIGVQDDRLTKEQLAGVPALVGPLPLPDLVPRPDFTVSIRGVRSVYYGIRGDTKNALMTKWAATSSKARFCGTIKYSWARGAETVSCIRTTFDYDWTTSENPWAGTCRITSFRPRLKMTMPIARWSGPSLVPRALVGWWKAEQREVRDHEAQHVRIYRKWLPVLTKRMVGASCSSAPSIMRRWTNQVGAAQEAYDKSEYGPGS